MHAASSTSYMDSHGTEAGYHGNQSNEDDVGRTLLSSTNSTEMLQHYIIISLNTVSNNLFCIGTKFSEQISIV